MVTGFGFIVIREVKRTEEVFPNNGYFSDNPAPSPSILLNQTNGHDGFFALKDSEKRRDSKARSRQNK